MIYIRGTSKQVEIKSYYGEPTDEEIVPKPWWGPGMRIFATLKDLEHPSQPDVVVEAQNLIADGGIAELKRAFDRATEITRY